MKEGDNYLVEYAKSFVGKLPYEVAGKDLTTGADCSGLYRQSIRILELKIDGSTRSLYPGKRSC
jgi:cell wall-associated NlpC family hydrolase